VERKRGKRQRQSLSPFDVELLLRRQVMDNFERKVVLVLGMFNVAAAGLLAFRRVFLMRIKASSKEENSNYQERLAIDETLVKARK
jgi:hypothetical protein